MTLVDPTQQLTGTPLVPVNDPFAGGPDLPSAFDLPGIDRKLQKIGAVESTWDFPPLPHQVKLDLASQHQVSHDDLGSFLHGLASDLNEAVNPFSAPPAAAATSVPAPQDPFSGDPNLFDGDPNSAGNRLRRYWNGIAGLAPPKLITPSATVDVKTEAMRRGLLPTNTPLDASWGPEMRGVQAEMLNQDFDKRLAGNRPGAISTGTVAEAIGNWMTPSGLLKAATTFDLVPDFKAIGHESSTWGDKWRHFMHHKTPAALIDAMTGPVDDIVVPIVNDALLVIGVSEAVVFARGLLAGAEAADAAANAYRTFSLANHLGQAYDVTAEANQFRRSSMLSNMLGRGLSAGDELTAFQRARLGASGMLTSWRDRTDVMLAKKALQTSGRLGLYSGAEHLLPGYQGGSVQLGDITGTVTHPLTQNHTTRLILGALTPVMDLTLAPSSIFGEHAIGEAGHRAAASLRSTFTDVTKSQYLTATAARSMHDALTVQAAAADAPASVVDLHQRMTDLMTKGQLSEAVQIYIGGDEAHAGQVLTWLSAHAALETYATSRAAQRLGSTQEMLNNPGKWRRWVAFYRNKGIAQLAHFGEDDVTAYASTRAFYEASNPTDRLKLIRKYMGQGSDDEMRAFVGQHMANRQTFWNDLLGNVDAGAFQKVLDDAMPTLGNYDAFVASTHDIAVARGDGLLNDAQFSVAHSESGRRLGQWPRTRDLNLSLHAAPPRGPQDLVERNFSPLARQLDPDTGKFTVMLADHPAKQDALELAHQATTLLKRRESLRFFEGTAEGQRVAAIVTPLVEAGQQAAGTALHEIPKNVISSWLDAAETGNITPRRLKDYAGLMRWASGQGVDMGSLSHAVDTDIETLSGHSVWSDLFGVGRDLTLPAGEKQLTAQAKKLRQAAYWMASAVHTGENASPELQALGGRLEQNGYKLVHGVQFIAPHDLTDLPGVFDEVNSATVRRLTLGNFIDRQAPAEYAALRTRQLFSNLSSATHDAAARGYTTAAGEAIPRLSPDSPELHDIVDLLRKKVLDTQELGDVNVANAIAERGFFGRTAARVGNGLQGIPISFTDLSGKQIKAAIAPTYGENFAGLVEHAIRGSQDVGGWERRGLLHLEDHLRAQDNVGQLLGVLGRTPIGESFRGGGVWRGVAKQAFSVRGTLGAAAGYEIGKQQTGSQWGGAVGALAGGVVAPSLGAKVISGSVTPKYESFLANHPTWTGYTHIADHLARLRDQMRFTLNPFFDLRRYVKGSVLAHTAELPEDVALPATVGMRGYIRQYGKASAGQMRAEFAAASKGEFNPETLDDVGKAFHQEGILGYNPTEYMSALYGHLRQQGVESAKAADIAKKVYSYGTTGRSAAELSANFIFFPFSFEKKLLTAGARFLANDMSRAAFLHDSLKAYDILNEHYDLSKRWQDHFPLLQQMEKLNAFAHGISPGELGGINRPLIEFGLGVLPVGKYVESNPILNAFLPQGVHIAGKEHGAAVVDLARRTLPVRNDINHLLDDVASQGHVLFAPSHKTANAEVRDGWAQVTELKKQIDTLAKSQGYDGFYAVMRDTDLQPLKDYYEKERDRIARSNPAWKDSINSVVARKVGLERDLSMRLGAINDRTNRGQASSLADQELAAFAETIKNLETALSSKGFSIDTHPESIPPEIYQLVQEAAVALAREGNGFQDLYNKYWKRQWGEIQERF